MQKTWEIMHGWRREVRVVWMNNKEFSVSDEVRFNWLEWSVKREEFSLSDGLKILFEWGFKI